MTWTKAQAAAWRENNRDKRRAYQQEWVKNNPDKVAQYSTARAAKVAAARAEYNALARERYARVAGHRRLKARANYAASRDDRVSKQRERVAKDQALYLWKRAQERARKKGVEFTILPEDVHIPDLCPVLGVALERGQGKFCPTSPTLDRVNNAHGYVKGNILVVSWRANRLKSDATLDEMRAILKFYEALS